ncbi:Threonine--tRNA ligase [uncultured archaeon]|nr:Threonine--tRNA ligase [uncultured archaeon]
MKILSLHCDYINFKPLKPAIKGTELPKEENKEVKVKEPLVILTAVEKADEENKTILEDYIKNILELKEKIGKVERIVLYPYAHLSSSLSSPDFAKQLLIDAEKALKEKKIEVFRAPFGFYKEFELKCKGHPLSELSRQIGTQMPIQENKTKIVEKNEVIDPKKLLASISKSKLDTSKLKENDHRIIGKNLDLFSFNEVAPGMVFWHNKGLIIYNELINYWREQHAKANYQEIRTPQIMDSKLWKISGHWDKYKENNFVTDYEGRPFLVKPMNCPGGMLVYKTSPKSYKDLPLKAGEIGTVHRTELSGVLAGLFRVIQFTQDDAHIFCTEEQLEEEIGKVMELIKVFYKQFKIEFDHVELSTRPEKRIGSDAVWDKAEKALENVLKHKKMKYQINAGDGAFYGPKIDFKTKDSLGRTWQTSTIQLDFSLPERFELEYADKDGTMKRPVMLHRVIYGSIERFLGVLLEETNGNLPTWLSPVQVKVISFTDRNEKAAQKVLDELKAAGIRAEADFTSTTVGDKVRNAALMKIPYVVTIGDKEEEKGTIALKRRGKDKPEFGVKLKDFLEEIVSEIKERK